MSRILATKPRRAYSRRGPCLKTLVFKMGGVSGATRRIIFSWRFPFTLNLLKLELRRRHPELIPGDGQIEGVIENLLKNKRLTLIGEGLYQQSEFVEENI